MGGVSGEGAQVLFKVICFLSISAGTQRRKRDPGRESELGAQDPQAGQVHGQSSGAACVASETLKSGVLAWNLPCWDGGALRAAVLSPGHLLTPCGLQEPLPRPGWAWGSLPELP